MNQKPTGAWLCSYYLTTVIGLYSACGQDGAAGAPVPHRHPHVHGPGHQHCPPHPRPAILHVWQPALPNSPYRPGEERDVWGLNKGKMTMKNSEIDIFCIFFSVPSALDHFGSLAHLLPSFFQPFGAWPGTSSALCGSDAPAYIFYTFNSSSKFLAANGTQRAREREREGEGRREGERG